MTTPIKPSEEKKLRAAGSSHHHLAALSLAALGVVFGDIGTSPLYAIRECFHGQYGIAISTDNVLGVLSLMFWALIIVVTLKYLTFILRADNHGEGGVIALTALIQPKQLKTTRARWILVTAGLFAASLLYGDGMITPAISVLSAIEGVKIIAPAFHYFVIPATVIILACLFLLQSRGTAKVGALFGPVIFVWFCALGILGFIQITLNPKILMAMFPWYGVAFLINNQVHGFLVLGAVFLVVTGAEALYADMGHFGRRPIRLVWIVLVLPALLLNYFGQGALLLADPEKAHHPFYAMVPSWGLIPMVILATAATIIASQAVITGAFSLTRQAIRLGYFPRLRILHTSVKHLGQIYVPLVNWILMAATICLVLAFRTTSKLAAAYGVAVTSTMLIATILFYVVARERWGWSRFSAGLPVCVFLVVDIAFFGANISKIFHGAWFPLVIGGMIYFMMITWKRGRESLSTQLKGLTPTFEEFQARLTDDPPYRISGQAVFLSGNPDIVPAALVQNLIHNKVLHSDILFLHFKTEEVPRVPNDEKVEEFKLGNGFYKVIAHYGFMEDPKVGNILALIREKGFDFKMEKMSFFLGRERLVQKKHGGIKAIRSMLFSFMSRNAQNVATFYDIPNNQIIEVGIQLEI